MVDARGIDGKMRIPVGGMASSKAEDEFCAVVATEPEAEPGSGFFVLLSQ